MAQIQPFKAIFNQTIFRIPDYQRGYSWTEKELGDLWADLYNTRIDGDVFHFTGTLTVNQFDVNDFEKIKAEGFKVNNHQLSINGINYKGYNLVDGQQRLTTILILLSRLLNSFENQAEKLQYTRQYFFRNEDGINNYLFGYHIDVPSHNFLIRDIFEDDSFEAENAETLYTHNLLVAKNYFTKMLDDLSKNEKRILVQKITDKLLFSILDLSESKESNLDVSMIFETLNFRGKQLSGLERFKNRVLYLLSKQPFGPAQIASRRELINKTWLEVYKWLGRNPKKPMVDDTFLKAFWLMEFSKDTMVAKDFKVYQYNLFEHDFSLLHLNDNEYMNPQNITNWPKKMRRAVKIWYFINHPYAVDEDEDFEYFYTEKIQRSLVRIHSFPKNYGHYMIYMVLPVLMRLLPLSNLSTLTEEEIDLNLKRIEKVLWAIERYNIMCFLLNGNNANYKQEDTFRNISYYYRNGSMLNGSSLFDYLINENLSFMHWDNVKFKIYQKDYFATWDGLYFFLKEYEEVISGRKVDKEVNINYLYPEDMDIITRNEYPDINSLTKVNRNKFTYSLGNLYISNTMQSAKSFKDHKKRITKSIERGSLIYESEIEFLRYQNWTRETIVERGKLILMTVLDYWKIPYPEEDAFYQDFFGNKV